MNLFELIEPEELTGFARDALADLAVNDFTLGRYFPDRQVEDIVVRYATGGGGLARTAKFRAYDTEPPVGEREGITRATVEIPTMAEKLFVSEYERYRLMANTDEAVNAVYNDTLTLMRSIAARLEVAKGRALIDASLTFTENGLDGIVMDFGRAAGHSVSTGTSWATHATADPLGDLLSWQETYTDTNGSAPGGMITSSTVLGHMLQNDALRGQMFALGGATVPSRIDVNRLTDYLLSYGLPPIEINDSKVSVDGVTTRIIDEDVVVFTRPRRVRQAPPCSVPPLRLRKS